jgi:hypothetical protein
MVGGKMKLGIKGAWVWTLLFAVLAVIGSESAACAAGLTVKIGQVSGGGDPPYDYVIQVYLDPGYSVITNNFFTVESLLGVTPANFPNSGDLASNTSEPDDPPSVLWAPSISLTQSTSPYASDVTWAFYSLNGTTIVNPGPGELYLGQFVAETTQSFTNPPYANGATIDYSWTVTNNSTGMPSSGNGIATFVPEPSSALLLLGGVGILPVFVLRRRRRRGA